MAQDIYVGLRHYKNDESAVNQVLGQGLALVPTKIEFYLLSAATELADAVAIACGNTCGDYFDLVKRWVLRGQRIFHTLCHWATVYIACANSQD